MYPKTDQQILNKYLSLILDTKEPAHVSPVFFVWNQNLPLLYWKSKKCYNMGCQRFCPLESEIENTPWKSMGEGFWFAVKLSLQRWNNSSLYRFSKLLHDRSTVLSSKIILVINWQAKRKGKSKLDKLVSIDSLIQVGIRYLQLN